MSHLTSAGICTRILPVESTGTETNFARGGNDSVLVINWALIRKTLRRYLTHLLLVVVIVGAVGLSEYQVPGLHLALPGSLAARAEAAPRVRGNAALARGGPLMTTGQSGDNLTRIANLHTNVPERPRRDIVTYTVQTGDNPVSIAAQYGLDPHTILWGNPDLGTNPELLQVGQVLNILPVDGVLHAVAEGDTLESVAEQYKVDGNAITGYEENQLPKDGKLTPGDYVVVPGGQREQEWTVPVRTTGNYSSGAAGSYYTGPLVGQGLGNFIWPTTGYISQYFWGYHRGLDIASPSGTPIVAADSGTVVFAGWSNQGYGNLVIIDHGNGFLTYYGHHSLIVVENGMWVGQGQLIGYMGSTGKSTGPHLHLEVRFNNVPLNPLDYLP